MKTKEEVLAEARKDAATTGQAYYVSFHKGQWVHYRAKWYEDSMNQAGFERHGMDTPKIYVPGPQEQKEINKRNEEWSHHHLAPKGLR